MGKAKLILGIIILLLGLFYAGAPHTMHTSLGVGFELEHNVHQILGVILVIAGLVVLVKGRK